MGYHRRMTLESIDKARYRRQFNRVMWAVIAALFVLALLIGQTLIALFPSEDGNHFAHNLSGVVTAGLIVSSMIYRYRNHPAMYEVVYVWRLKQELNQIYRKQKKLLLAVDEGNEDAMTIMNFSYKGSQQLYRLDDNIVTMEELLKQDEELQIKAQNQGFTPRVEEYHRALLQQF